LDFEVLVEELVQLFLLYWSQRVDFCAEVAGIWYQFDGMIPLLPIGQFIKRLLGKNVSEFLVWLGHYIFKAGQWSTPQGFG